MEIVDGLGQLLLGFRKIIPLLRTFFQLKRLVRVSNKKGKNIGLKVVGELRRKTTININNYQYNLIGSEN